MVVKKSIDKNSGRVYKPKKVLSSEASTPIMISVSEAGKLGGVTAKTIRRAIQDNLLTYTVIKDRYSVDLRSVIKFLHQKRKLRNKLNEFGIGQYIHKWKD